MTTVTFDPAAKNAYIVLSGGNLVAAGDGTQAFVEAVKATEYNSTGKLYYEVLVGGSNNDAGTRVIGIGKSTASLGNGANVGGAGSSGYQDNAARLSEGGSAGYGASWASGDTISVLWDADVGTLAFWKNGVDQGTAYTVTGSYTPMVSMMGNVSQNMTANYGATAFSYTPPAGYDGWDSPAPTPGIGTATFRPLTAEGSRIAAGAVTMESITGVGGYNGIGAVTLEQLTLSGAGGPKAGTVTFESLTASGTGYQATRGDATLESLTATGTGYDSEIWTFAGSAKLPTLSSLILTGEVITFAGTAPTPVLEIGTKDARLTAPVPTLVATLLPGRILSASLRAPAPVLATVNDNPAIITVEGSARVPILLATLAAGQILAFSGSARSPTLVASGVSGNVITFLGSAVAPILSASGYPAFTITFAGVALTPYLVSVLSGPASTNYRTWVVNLRKGALTEYGPEWVFNSFATFNNQILAAGSSGIVVLGTQDLDNATAISSTVKSGKDKFASSVIKRIPRIYINYATDGDAQFKLITTEGGSRTYALNWNHGTGVQTRRIPVGKGPKSVTWQWEYTNVAGADFDLDAVLAYPAKLRRRVQ